MNTEDKPFSTRASIFRKTDKSVPETEDRQAPSQPTIKPAKLPRVKATFPLPPADIVAIDIMQTEEFKSIGKKPERSEIASRAIQSLFKQQKR